MNNLNNFIYYKVLTYITSCILKFQLIFTWTTVFFLPSSFIVVLVKYTTSKNNKVKLIL